MKGIAHHAMVVTGGCLFVIATSFLIFVSYSMKVVRAGMRFAVSLATASVAQPRNPPRPPAASPCGSDTPTVLMEEAPATPVVYSVQNDVAPGSPVWELLEPLVKQYGHNTVAHSMLHNPEFSHMYVAGHGSLVFVVVQHYGRQLVVAIGDPLAPAFEWLPLTQLFLQRYPDAYFMHMGRPYACLLAHLGYLVNEMGAECEIQVQSWTYTGRTRTIRTAARNARASGVAVREVDDSELSHQLRHAMHLEVSHDWLQQKAIADRVLRVLVRHVDFEGFSLRDGARLFVAETEDFAGTPKSSSTAASNTSRSSSSSAGVAAEVLLSSSKAGRPHKPPRPSKAARRQARLAQQQQQQQQTGDQLMHEDLQGAAVALQEDGQGQGSPLQPVDMNGSRYDLCVEVPDGADSPGKEMGHKQQLAAVMADAPSVAAWPADGTAAVAVCCEGANNSSSKGTGGSSCSVTASDSAPPTPADGQGAPSRLAGFVLLDPVWEAGEVVGYVPALCRMSRDAHPGTLKVLYEEILATLKVEGKRSLNFGLCPAYNQQERELKGAWWIRVVFWYLFNFANNLYAFQNLAFAKTRYGGGLSADGTTYRDPAVTMPHMYMAMRSHQWGMALLDQWMILQYVGILSSSLADTWLQHVGLRAGPSTPTI